MNCPHCSDPHSSVTETRRFESNIYRRRRCDICLFIFWTVEIRIAKPPLKLHLFSRNNGIKRSTHQPRRKEPPNDPSQ